MAGVREEGDRAMAKFKVLTTVTVRCEVYVEAENRASAEYIVQGMEPDDLLDHAVAEEVEIDAVGVALRSGTP